VEAATAAAAAVCALPGTTVCTAADLTRRLGGGDRVVLDTADLAARLDAHRAAGRRVVFTNGCFDVLHRGHVSYLDQAKRLGDVLVVALNSDAGVARLKGPDRPVNPVDDRAAVLAALSCVDYLTVFDEDTPVKLLESVRPDVYVKGGDYTPDTLPEAPVVRRLGGEVHIVDYLEDRSTTRLLDRIRAEPDR
jgi:rfaE bifunctional protein nucleotidyltransferase chain/domain